MKKRFSVSPLSILMVVLLSVGIFSTSLAFQSIGNFETVETIQDVGVGDIGLQDLEGIQAIEDEGAQGIEGFIDPGIEDIILQGFCGDGNVGGDEACDDGNGSNTDACLNTCETASCGDQFIQVGIEECDDDNTTSGDGCSSSCLAEVCGNGRVDFGEECDDGNSENYDVCNNNCEERQLGPTGNPPLGGVTPIFSGLIVDGFATIASLAVDGNIDVDGAALLDLIILNGNLLMQGTAQLYTRDIYASGVINSTFGSIGSHYTVWRFNTVTLNGFHEEAIVGCFGDDEMTGCSGYFSHDSSSDRFAGSYIGGLLGPDTDDEEYCITLAANGGGSNDRVYSTARCFDPSGNRHGKYERTTY